MEIFVTGDLLIFIIRLISACPGNNFTRVNIIQTQLNYPIGCSWIGSSDNYEINRSWALSELDTLIIQYTKKQIYPISIQN